jgi:hypothetical protein
MFHFPSQLSFEAIFVLINIQLVILETYAEMYKDVHVKCPLFLSNFNQNWKVSANFIKAPFCQILRNTVQQFLGCFMHTNKWMEQIGAPQDCEHA